MSNVIHVEFLKSSNTDWNGKSMTSGTDYYSDPIRVNRSNGYAALFVGLSGGADDVDIDFEVSFNGNDFYTPYDSAGNDMGNVITDGVCIYATRANWWIVLEPQPAEWIRFKFAPDANSTVTAKYIQQEEI